MNTDIQRNLLIINSADRTSGNSSNFKYNLGDNSLEINAISLKSASVPHVHSNISNNNNKIIVETGAEFTLTTAAQANYNVNGISSIPFSAGVYTLNSLISTLNSNQTFGEFEYDSVSNRVKFTITSAAVNTNGVTFLTGGSPEIISLLGFSLPVNCPTGVGSNITAINAPTYVENVITEVEVAASQYTATELVTELAIVINPLIQGTIQGSINLEGKAEFTGATQPWRFNPSPLASLIGWNTDVKVFGTSPVAAYNIFDLYGTRNLYISSRVLANGYNSLQAKGEKSSIMGSMPVCSSYGGIDKWEAKYPIKKNYPQPINVNSIDIKILDDTGGVIDLQGTDVVIIFEIWNSVKL